MVDVTTRANAPELSRIVEQIVRQFHPQKVILFGSNACGKQTEASDVDLLVVMETNENPLHTVAHIAAAIDHPFPLDILVMRPSDWGGAAARQHF